MSYTWGYVKNASLAKLDLTEEEATIQNLLSRFPYYANEVITQICSSIKPKYSFVEFNITIDLIGVPQDMPDDFVSFGDDVSYEIKKGQYWNGTSIETINIKKELHDTDYEYYGNSQIVFKRTGNFHISYNARWYTFLSDMSDVELPIPNDIVDCIPSYIASQCYKIDDEYKSSVFRNEYEMMLARIDNTHYKTIKTIEIEGDW